MEHSFNSSFISIFDKRFQAVSGEDELFAENASDMRDQFALIWP